jgi:hypothetical protein
MDLILYIYKENYVYVVFSSQKKEQYYTVLYYGEENCVCVYIYIYI